MAVLLRSCRRLGRKSVKLPLVGTVSWMSLLVNIICLAFAVFWFVKRHTSYAWVGQDILGICLIITALQVVRLPNIKVATVLLCCAYDKFKKRVVSSGYFLWLTIGYGVGLAVVLGVGRGELKELWNYGIEEPESHTPEDHHSNGVCEIYQTSSAYP
ncbi:Signal peptide peptidase-like 3 [Raphanus sativus]|nr:Signal peptide peptidase-like 3 [Raphanus sativus]